MNLTDLFGTLAISIPSETFFISSTSVEDTIITLQPAVLTGLVISHTPGVSATAKIYNGNDQIFNIHSGPATAQNIGAMYSYSPTGGVNCLSGISVTFETNGTNGNGGLTINYVNK